MSTKVYLAAQYGWRDDIKAHAKRLEELGFEVTSSWLKERKPTSIDLNDCTDKFLKEHAVQDVIDIDRADVLVLFTVDPTIPTKRGGRHVEFGYALATDLMILICGPRENIFHYLPRVKQFDTFDEVVAFLQK